MEWKQFNDNDANSAVKGRYRVFDDTLFIHVSGKLDWRLFVKRIKVAYHMYVDKKRFHDALWVFEHLDVEKNIIADKSIKKVQVSGHLTGGAIASLLHFLIKKRYPNKHVEDITFSSYNVGNSEFTSYLFANDGSCNYTTRGNFVTCLPLNLTRSNYPYCPKPETWALPFNSFKIHNYLNYMRLYMVR